MRNVGFVDVGIKQASEKNQCGIRIHCYRARGAMPFRDSPAVSKIANEAQTAIIVGPKSRINNLIAF